MGVINYMEDFMRVISGFLRGRNIKGDNIVGTRPTMDSVKESLFAMIQSSIKDSVCLDLFAGSGSLGIEAVSNGAKLVFFVDNNYIAINTIKNNIKTFNIESFSKVLLNDYFKSLLYFKNNNIKFNLIFLDPPYKEHLIDNILKFIDESNLLYEGGQVICEFDNELLKDKYNTLEVIKTRKYGDKYIKIYKKLTSNYKM
jgi:16S rRNA (guanine(966)-N(2))-methyltransferase RsmD